MSETTPRKRLSTRAFTLWALGFALLLACVVSVWASSSPDGLEFVAGSVGFLESGQDSIVAGSPFADYETAWVPNPWLSVALAGLIGCAVTFGLAWLVGRIARRAPADD
ncbi:MAG: PDGLE domain-containing protein [Microbacterium sp.]